MFFGPFIVPVVLFLTIGAVVILRGPIGKALADRLAGRAPQVLPPGDEALSAEVEELRYRMTDLEERLDFAERMLAQHRQPEQLGSGE